MKFKPLAKWEAFLDLLMTPLMYLISGTFTEIPQRTHRWNNRKLSAEQVEKLNDQLTLLVRKKRGASKRLGIFFHIPILGGWRHYVVLRSLEGVNWYVGWKTSDTAGGISAIPLSGPVRVLRGNEDVKFFGLNSLGEQIPIELIFEGQIGDGRYESRNYPLL